MRSFSRGSRRAYIETARTMYVPGPLVRDRNDLVVLELHGAAAPVARFVPAPDLGATEE